MKNTCKKLMNALALFVTWPCAILCWLELRAKRDREEIFSFWAHVFALAPGLPGMYVRRAFYRQTLEQCDGDFHIGFGSLFTHRQVCVEREVYIGTFALIGSVVLRRGCLIGSRASLLSGGHQHQLDERGVWMPSDKATRVQITIDQHAWLGEGALVMADIGAHAMVAAGSVVSSVVPGGVMVAGNPARFVKKIYSPPLDGRVTDEAETPHAAF